MIQEKAEKTVFKAGKNKVGRKLSLAPVSL